MTMPAPLSIASWIYSTSWNSAFDWRNSTEYSPPGLAAHRFDLG
jgi:hypothetical protein